MPSGAGADNAPGPHGLQPSRRRSCKQRAVTKRRTPAPAPTRHITTGAAMLERHIQAPPKLRCSSRTHPTRTGASGPESCLSASASTTRTTAAPGGPVPGSHKCQPGGRRRGRTRSRPSSGCACDAHSCASLFRRARCAAVRRLHRRCSGPPTDSPSGCPDPTPGPAASIPAPHPPRTRSRRHANDEPSRSQLPAVTPPAAVRAQTAAQTSPAGGGGSSLFPVVWSRCVRPMRLGTRPPDRLHTSLTIEFFPECALNSARDESRSAASQDSKGH